LTATQGRENLDAGRPAREIRNKKKKQGETHWPLSEGTGFATPKAGFRKRSSPVTSQLSGLQGETHDRI
jgi:hypothetical protein